MPDRPEILNTALWDFDLYQIFLKVQKSFQELPQQVKVLLVLFVISAVLVIFIYFMSKGEIKKEVKSKEDE